VTQETQLSLTNRATHLRKCYGVANSKNTPSLIRVTVPNLVVLGETVYRHKENSW